jgi:hypothetical protein
MSAFLTVQLDRSLGGQAVQVGILYLLSQLMQVPIFPALFLMKAYFPHPEGILEF